MSTWIGVDHARLMRERIELCRQLPVSTKQQITASMALLGWRFPRVEIYSSEHGSNVHQFTLVAPTGEEFRYFLDFIEDAGVWAHCIWNNKSQAMWTGRKLEDFE